MAVLNDLLAALDACDALCSSSACKDLLEPWGLWSREDWNVGGEGR